MATPASQAPERSCASCGAAAPPRFRAPPAEQAPDLDFRPGEPARSTLPRWVVTCRRCGACAPDLTDLPPGAAGLVQSAAYKSLDRPAPALRFLRWAMLCTAGERHEAAEATLQAAWTLDDAEDASGAASLRREAALLWGTPDTAESALRLLDVLRRAGEFERASALAADLDKRPLDENSARIVAFQRDRIAERDAGRHLLSSALRPPARTPHAAQGRRSGGGFLGRLFGR